MPFHIEEIVADVNAEPGEIPEGGAGEEPEANWYCAALQRARLALERRERLRVD